MKKLCLLLTLLCGICAGAQPQLTNIPTIYVTTEGGAAVTSKEDYVPSAVTIVTSNADDAIDGKTAGIRGRGNSTWDLPKKPFRLKFDKKIRLFNRPAKAKSWTLLANYGDKSLMRNGLAFEISRFAGFDFSPTAVFADLVLNGQYLGNYLVSDQMEVNAGRVDIDEMDATCLEGESLTGGYFLEIDGFGGAEPVHFSTPKGLTITVKSPDDDVIQPAQLAYIRSFINRFENALFSSGFDDPEGGFRVLADEKSLVDWYICCELTGNPDSFWSTYIYKKRSDDHLYFGPLWDFDIAFNNDNRLGDAVRKLMRDNAHEPRTWIKRMWQAEWFRAAVYRRWCQLVDQGLEQHLLDYIDSTAAEIEASAALNFDKWRILGRRVFREQFIFTSWHDEVAYLRRYVSERIAFLGDSFMMSGAEGVIDGIVTGKEYYVMHYVGLFATPDASNFYIRNYEGDSQRLTFVSAGTPGVWGIRMPDGRYVASTDRDKYCVYMSGCEDARAQFTVEPSPFPGYARIRNMHTRQCLGIEHTAHNSRISTNKSGTDTNHAWKILPVDPDGIDDIAADPSSLCFDPSTRLLTLPSATDVSVYSIDGRLALTASGRAISLATLPPGLYLIHTPLTAPLKIALP